MSAGSALAIALLPAAVAVSVPAAPIWRRLRPPAAPAGTHAVLAFANRVWCDRRCARWGPAAAAVLGGLLGLMAGPVSAAVLAVYMAAGFVIVRGLAVRRTRQRAYRLAADAVVGFAADLRAGLSLEPAWRVAQAALRQAQATVLPGWRGPSTGEVGALDGDVAVIAARVVAATGLAQASGAPLADVLDRLDAHLRAVDRARSVASSQTAGARVSAGLLAAMPVAGVGLGAVIGVDAWRVLLHTPLGAAAVGLAVSLQLGGIAWAARLAGAEVAP